VQDYWLPTPFASFLFTSPPVRHSVPSHFNWTLPGFFPAGKATGARDTDHLPPSGAVYLIILFPPRAVMVRAETPSVLVSKWPVFQRANGNRVAGCNEQ